MDIIRNEATAFSPCHVSAFFVPHIERKEPAKTGSWGAGLCLGAGVVATVEVEAADQAAITVERTHGEGPTQVTQAALRNLLGQHPLDVTCTIQQGAPSGQGFGVSGASALAAAFALARCLGTGRSEALKAAHLAEVRSRTGLGDVVAEFLGGAVIRRTPGIPPYGTQQRLPAQGEVVVVTVGEEIDTAEKLRDQATMEAVTKAGRACLEGVLERPTLEAIFEAGARFAHATELVSGQTLDAIDACAEGGVGMAAMLGNTVVGYGETEILEDALQTWGQPHVLPIDGSGLRVLDGMPEVPQG